MFIQTRLAKHRLATRTLAIPSSEIILAKPPKPPQRRPLDSQIFSFLKTGKHRSPSIQTLLSQYDSRAGRVLDATLAYESTPLTDRRVNIKSAQASGVVFVAHVLQAQHESYLALCSGFAIGASSSTGEKIIVSCAHTMEEIRRSSLLNSPEISTSSFIIAPDSSPSSLSITPVLEVLSSMPRSDLVLLSARVPHLPSLPVSPYPARPDDPLHIHVVSPEPSSTEYVPWLGEWRSWQPGQVLGYRDFAGREAQPGTYDALSHMLFKPIPTQGSSGGPIIGENGSVIGIVSGSRMDNSVEGIRGWGTPSEAIYEMFSLPGLRLKSG